jgi:hypothetical protein
MRWLSGSVVVGIGLADSRPHYAASDNAVAQHRIRCFAARHDGSDGAERVCDGICHASTLLITLTGVFMLWSAGRV